MIFSLLCDGYRDRSKFDTFVRDTLSVLLPVLAFPTDGTVFDYFIDPQRCSCVPWNQRPLHKSHHVAVSSGYIVISEVILL